MPGRFGFLWENLGPPHHDRVRAVAEAGHHVVALQLFRSSEDYDWSTDPIEVNCEIVTLAKDEGSISALRLAGRIVRAVMQAKLQHVFLCHYNEPAVFLAAIMLRARGVEVFGTFDSKGDDRKRGFLNFLARKFMIAPYQGALVASPRSARYVASMGIPRDRIALNYSSLDITRLRGLGEQSSRSAFVDRPFLIVARLVEKKNIETAIRAFARYRIKGGRRWLQIAGDGPLDVTLKKLANECGVDESVVWRGSLNQAEVAKAMGESLAMILPSTVEQFGLVVTEALAQGLVPIVSSVAGAVDVLINHGENGFIFDPMDEGALVDAMEALDRDEALWKRMSTAAYETAERGGVRHFVESVETLAGIRPVELYPR